MLTRNRGQVLLIFLAGLLGLLGITALGVDVGYMYTARHELQRCTDAGALAGASAFIHGSWSDPGVRALADSRARAFAAKDKVATSTLAPASEVSVAFPAAERVRVQASRTVPLFFSRLFLGPTRTITATSVAEASAVGSNVKGLKPWGIPYPWEDTDGDGLFDAGETVHRDCPDGVPDPSRYFCPGTRVILKIGTPKGSSKNPNNGIPSTQQESGHTIVNGSQTAYSVGDAITLEPGNMVGPTRQGTNELIDADPQSAWNNEKNLPESSQYHANDGSWMNSPRVIRIPIYDPEAALTNGRTDMVVAAFGGFWIESIGNQGTVYGRYIPLQAFGAGPLQGPSSGPVLKVLRLVE
ncbi:MAG: Tad protein [Actinobacteria bacterium]|nr:Tad protein [Actinomycetota bacterium]